MKPEDLKKIQEIANTLSAVLKSLKLYQAGHKTIDEMVNRLYDFIKELLERIDVLEFEIDEEGMKYEGKLILSSKEAEEDFIFKLYKDGVRLITFNTGLNASELMCFLQILVKPLPTDQDIVTSLWEQEFKNITISAVEALHNFFARELSEEDKFLQKDVQKWVEKIKDINLSLPESIKVKNEEGECFTLKETLIPLEKFQRVKQNAIQNLIINLLDSLNSPDKEIIINAAKTLKILQQNLLKDADFEKLSKLLTILSTAPPLKEVEELKVELISEATIKSLVSALFTKEIKDSKEIGFFINSLPDDRVPFFLNCIYLRKKELVYPLLNNLSIFRPICFVNFLKLIQPSDALDILNKIKSLSEETLVLLFNTKNSLFQREALNRLKEPKKEMLKECLHSSEKDLRMAALRKILTLHTEELIDNLVKEIEKEEFLNKDMEEKERWIFATSIVGKNSLELFFLSFFERKSSIFTPNIEERKIWAAKALKIIGTEKSIPYLQKEAEKFATSGKLKEACQKAIEEIKRRCKIQ